MSQNKPKTRITIVQYTGLATNRGPFGGKPGDAKTQRNLRSMRPGVLQTRGGQRLVRWS